MRLIKLRSDLVVACYIFLSLIASLAIATILVAVSISTAVTIYLSK